MSLPLLFCNEDDGYSNGYGNDYGGLFHKFLDWDLQVEAVNDTNAGSNTTYPSIPTM